MSSGVFKKPPELIRAEQMDDLEEVKKRAREIEQQMAGMSVGDNRFAYEMLRQELCILKRRKNLLDPSPLPEHVRAAQRQKALEKKQAEREMRRRKRWGETR